MDLNTSSYMNSYADFIKDVAHFISAKDTHDIFAVIYVDITDFQLINDFYGFQEGNRLLDAMSAYLSSYSTCQLKRRIFSDHFLCLFTFETDLEIPAFMEKWVIDMKTFLAGQRVFHSNCRPSIASGLCILDHGKNGLSAAIDNANTARKESKKRQRTYITWFDEDMKNELRKFKELEVRILSALDSEDFCFYLQPKVNLHSGKIIGAEALTRWIQMDGTTTFPDEFIPIMEQNGSIIDLDLLIYKQVCKYLQKCLKNGMKTLPISVNLSRLHVLSPHFAEKIHAIATTYGVPPYLLEFEITETVILSDLDTANKIMTKLHNYGYKTSVDDFGAGFTGIHIFRALEFNVLKLDKSFVPEGDKKDQVNELIISSVVDIASSLHTSVLCEGTETLAQCKYMKDLGCDIAQGYYFSKPLPPSAYMELLEQNGGYFPLPWAAADSDLLAKEYCRTEDFSQSQMHTVTNSLIHLIPCGIAGFEENDGKLLFVSDKTLAMFGYTREEFESQSSSLWSYRFFPESEEGNAHLLHSVPERQNFHFDYQQADKNNKQLYISLYGTRVSMPEFGTYILCCFFDNTEHERNKAVLNMLNHNISADSSESILDRLNAVLDHTPGDILILKNFNDSLDIDYLTHGLSSSFGYTEKEFQKILAHNNGMELVYEKDRSSLIGSVLAATSEKTPHITFNYRSVYRDASIRWHNLSADYYTTADDGAIVYHGIITSIDRLKQQEDELHQFDLRYQVAADMLGVDVWSYDFQTGMLDLPVTEKYSMLDLNGSTKISKEDFITYGHIHPDYLESYQALYEPPGGDTELLALTKDNGYQWFHIKTQVIAQQDQKFLIGISKDISDEKHRQEKYRALQKKVMQDSLTGLYNRNYMQRLIQNCLAKLSNSKYAAAFLMIDVDDFKIINDKFSHNTGDRVLKDIARILENKMPADSVLGRTGGDEFVMFIVHVEEEAAVCETAQSICDCVHQITLHTQEQEAVPISVSIGISFAQSNVHFEKLYEQADRAMYISKHKGKNNYTVYTL